LHCRLQTNVSSTFQPELFTEGSYVYYPIKDNRIKIDLYKPQSDKYIKKEMLDEPNRKKFEELVNAKEEMNPIIIKYYFK